MNLHGLVDSTRTGPSRGSESADRTGGQDAQASTTGSDHRRRVGVRGEQRHRGGRGRAGSGAAQTVRTLRYFAFNINNTTNDPGFVSVPGTKPGVFAQGDELIINDQLTVTRKKGSGYPIVGFDSGVCTLTRLPEKYARQTVGNCVVTAVWTKHGSLTFQGAVRFVKQRPQSAVLAVTGGTGSYDGQPEYSTSRSPRVTRS